MYQILFSTILLSIISLSVTAAETAQSVLKHVITQMNGTPVKAVFDINANGISQIGDITLAGKKFVITTSDLSTWYDGKTQWTLSKAVNEVNITEPTNEELAEINPLIILSSLSSRYNVEMAGSTAGTYELLLVARDKDSGIASARVKINSATWLPGEFTIHTSSGQQFNIRIISINNLKSVNNDIFIFNPKSYPGVETIDMR